MDRKDEGNCCCYEHSVKKIGLFLGYLYREMTNFQLFWSVKIGLHAEPSTKDPSVQSSYTKLACFACHISPHQLYPLQVKAKHYRNSATMCKGCQEQLLALL